MHDTRTAVRRVLVITLALNLTVSAAKIVIGVVTGALSVTADGFHSLMDGASNLLGLVAHRIAGKPADADHPYGHRRYETLAAAGVGVLLLVTAFEIVSGALERLQNPQPPQVSPLTVAVLVGTLIVNVIVSTYERREGRRLRSELLIADAANTGADVYVTLSVLLSMFLVAAGWVWADTLAALIIVGLIGRAAWQILRRTGGVLVDTAPYPSDRLAGLAASAPGVESVIRARSRGTPDAAHIDIDVQVHPAMTAVQTAAIAEAIRQQMRDHLDGVSEIEVHFQPPAHAPADYALEARAHADAMGLSTHEVRVNDLPAGKLLEMHVEVPPGQTLGEAHAQVSALEAQVRASLPELAEVVTHIEPRENAAALTDENAAEAVCARALGLLKARFPSADWHDLRAAGASDQGFTVTLHVGLDAQITVEAAHRLAEEAETLLRSADPRIRRVTIHTEPLEALA